MHINTYINTLAPRKREKTNLIFWGSWLDLRPPLSESLQIKAEEA